MSLELLTDEERQHLASTALVRHRLEEQYVDLEQQNETAVVGLWLFLATEIMFFGTLFTALAAYHSLYPAAFEHASRSLNWQIGGINTVVLLISSLMMALAVYCVRTGHRSGLLASLLLTIAFGLVFLALKTYEYYDDWVQGLILGSRFEDQRWLGEGLTAAQIPHVKLFLLFYWIMTGFHAVHMIIGIAAVGIMVCLAWRRHFDTHYYGPIEVTGLYWHFIDIVWIFLLPMLYLLGTHAR